MGPDGWSRRSLEAGRYKPHTLGKSTLAMQARKGNAIPMGTGHPVRPALVTLVPLSLL